MSDRYWILWAIILAGYLVVGYIDMEAINAGECFRLDGGVEVCQK